MAKRKPKKKNNGAAEPEGYPANPDAGTALLSLEPPPPGRTSFKLTPEIIEDFKRLLSKGRTDKDACELTGVSQSSFYFWLQVGRAVKGLEAMPKSAPVEPARRKLCAEFLDTITRARAEARGVMVDAIMKAAEGFEGKEVTVTTFTETRLNPKTGEPYTYQKVTTSEKYIDYAPNPAIALEYLQRRDKPNWSVRSETIEIDFNVEAVRMIQAGEVDYQILMEEFHNEAQVLEWFRQAGVTPQINPTIED